MVRLKLTQIGKYKCGNSEISMTMIEEKRVWENENVVTVHAGRIHHPIQPASLGSQPKMGRILR